MQIIPRTHKSERKTKTLAIAAFASLVLAACGTAATDDETQDDEVQAEGESHQITVSIFHPESDPWTHVITPFFEEVEEQTDGRITFQPQYAGALASVSDNLDAVSSGAVDMGLDLASTLSAQVPEFTYFEALGSYPQDYAEQWENLYEEIHPEFASILKDQNVELLTWGPGGSELIFFNANDEFLTEPSDFEGLTLRTAGTWQGRQIEDLGGSSISMDPGELYLALQQGTVDATPQAATLGIGASLHEVAPYLASINLTFNTLVYIVNDDIWGQFSEEDQEIIEEAARNASLAVPATMQEQEQLAIDEMRSEDGVEFYELTEEERDAIFDAIQPVLEEAADVSSDASEEGARLVQFIRENM